MLQSLNLLLKKGLAPSQRAHEANTPAGPLVDSAVYTRNLQQLRELLPPSWRICAGEVRRC